MSTQIRCNFKVVLIIGIMTLTQSIFAQQHQSRITGTVLCNQVPLEFVTVTLAPSADSTQVILFTTTDSLGFFTLDIPKAGTYKIECTLMGYQATSKNIIIDGMEEILLLNPIHLIEQINALGLVTVTAQKKWLEKTGEGFIVNVSANLTQAGGTATDILKSTPTVTVDADGGITLRGKSPLILINGRNSNLVNADQIAASSIESIEIINNPTARYDANAESGIINIRLKKNKSNGTNGSFSLGAGLGARGRVSSSVLLNHKVKKWNIGMGYDNRFAGRTRTINGSRINYFITDNYLLNQDRKDTRLEQLQNVKLNFDFTPNASNVFALEVIGNLEGQDNNESLNTRLYDINRSFNSNTNRHSNEIARSKVAEFALDYTRQFVDPGKSLTASLTSSLNIDRENTGITSQPLSENFLALGNPYLERTHNYENGRISTARIDYAFAVSKKTGFEIGYKGVFRNVEDDYETAQKVNESYVIQASASTVFSFSEHVQAAYAVLHSSPNAEKNKWQYDLGVRAEQVFNTGNTRDQNTKFDNQYLKLFPTASISYHLSGTERMKWSYGKRINRPSLGQLNPFTDITDSLNPHSGNPNLKPEIIHAMEWSYTKGWDTYSVSANLFYRHAINTIRPYYQLLAHGVNLNMPINIGSANTYGLETIFDAEVAKWYSFNASVSLFQQELKGGDFTPEIVQHALGWTGKVVNNFVSGRNNKLQIVGNYNSALATPQGIRIEQYYLDMGFQHLLGKANARLGITVVDLLNTLKSGFVNQTMEFESYRYSKADTRAIMITFAYSFKTAFKDKLLENQFSKEY